MDNVTLKAMKNIVLDFGLPRRQEGFIKDNKGETIITKKIYVFPYKCEVRIICIISRVLVILPPFSLDVVGVDFEVNMKHESFSFPKSFLVACQSCSGCDW